MERTKQKLFIFNFPRDMEEIKLVELFRVFGTVDTVVMDKNNGKGYGFITMTDHPGADREIAAMDETEAITYASNKIFSYNYL